MPLVVDPENPTVDPMGWMDILGVENAAYIVRTRPDISTVLTVLAGLHQPKLVLDERFDGGRRVQVVNRDCYFGALLREGKELGLLTAAEYSDIHGFLAREFLG